MGPGLWHGGRFWSLAATSKKHGPLVSGERILACIMHEACWEALNTPIPAPARAECLGKHPAAFSNCIRTPTAKPQDA